MHRLAAGAVPPGRRWGERRVDLCSSLMCVWAAQGKVGTERDARDLGGPDDKQQTLRAAPERGSDSRRGRVATLGDEAV